MKNTHFIVVGDDFSIQFASGKGGYAKAGFLTKAIKPSHDLSMYFPVVCADTGFKKVTSNNQEHQYQLWDTSGVNPGNLNCYTNGDLYCLLFSIYDQNTLKHLSDWFHAIKQNCPEGKIIVIGITDPLTEEGKITADREVSVKQAREYAYQIGAIDYQECSVNNAQQINDVFIFAAGLYHHRQSSVEIAKARRQYSFSKFALLPEPIVIEILGEVGTEFTQPKKAKAISQSILNSVPSDGGKFSNPYKPGYLFNSRSNSYLSDKLMTDQSLIYTDNKNQASQDVLNSKKKI